MAVMHSYYRILNVDTDADYHTIVHAIDDVRKKDTSGNFAETLRAIEMTLTDPVLRQKYDDDMAISTERRADYDALARIVTKKKASAPPPGDFLDVQASDVRRYEQQTKIENLRSSSTKKEQEEDLKYPWVFPWKTFFVLLFLGGLGFGGYILGKPFYYEYKTYKQADQALNDLFIARDRVMEYIRKNKVYPTNTIPNFSPLEQTYEVTLTPNNIIRLTFTEHAMKKLQGSSYELEPYEIPNMGLNWRCSIDSIFPPKYKPPRCF